MDQLVKFKTAKGVYNEEFETFIVNTTVEFLWLFILFYDKLDKFYNEFCNDVILLELLLEIFVKLAILIFVRFVKLIIVEVKFNDEVLVKLML